MRGNLQEGDYVTFALVISWISVHIFLVLSITFHWMTCSIDFSNAFVQAMLKEPVWTHLQFPAIVSDTVSNLLARCDNILSHLSIHLLADVRWASFVQSSLAKMEMVA
jgi:hypothetical protein